ncbi:MAG: YjjG family noncanonical pyrimidine nucleotidase [Acidobacteriota bacterium]
MPNYTWILFDADGTLFDYQRAEVEALTRAFSEAGLAFEDQYLATYREVNHKIWLELERGEITRAELTVERFERFFQAIGETSDAAAFSDRYLALLAQGSFLIEGAEATVRELQDRVGLVLITNGLAAVQRPRLAGSPLADLFQHVVISEEAGAVKPHPAIFDATFATLGQPRREDVLIVGDSLTSDIQGGSDYGIDTCWYNPAGAACELDLRITYDIRDIGEVVGLVEG